MTLIDRERLKQADGSVKVEILAPSPNHYNVVKGSLKSCTC